jgi:hypothetical protein
MKNTPRYLVLCGGREGHDSEKGVRREVIEAGYDRLSLGHSIADGCQ